MRSVVVSSETSTNNPQAATVLLGDGSSLGCLGGGSSGCAADANSARHMLLARRFKKECRACFPSKEVSLMEWGLVPFDENAKEGENPPVVNDSSVRILVGIIGVDADLTCVVLPLVKVAIFSSSSEICRVTGVDVVVDTGRSKACVGQRNLSVDRRFTIISAFVVVFFFLGRFIGVFSTVCVCVSGKDCNHLKRSGLTSLE